MIWESQFRFRQSSFRSNLPHAEVPALLRAPKHAPYVERCGFFGGAFLKKGDAMVKEKL
jgi:hypothetical protein